MRLVKPEAVKFLELIDLISELLHIDPDTAEEVLRCLELVDLFELVNQYLVFRVQLDFFVDGKALLADDKLDHLVGNFEENLSETKLGLLADRLFSE